MVDCVELVRSRRARADAERAEVEATEIRVRERREFKDKVQRELLSKASLSGIAPKSYDALPLQPGLAAMRWLVPKSVTKSKRGGSSASRRSRSGAGVSLLLPDTLMFRAPPSKPLWIAASSGASSSLAARRRLPRAWRLSFFQACCATLGAPPDELARFFASGGESGESGRLAAAALDSVVAVKKSKVWSNPQKSRTEALSVRSLRLELRRELVELDGFCLQKFVRGRGKRAVVYRVVWRRDRHAFAFSIVNQKFMCARAHADGGGQNPPGGVLLREAPAHSGAGATALPPTAGTTTTTTVSEMADMVGARPDKSADTTPTNPTGASSATEPLALMPNASAANASAANASGVPPKVELTLLHCVTTENPNVHDLAVFEMTGKAAVQYPAQVVAGIARHLEQVVMPSMRLEFTEVACDFVRDRSGAWNFIQIKAFQMSSASVARCRRWALRQDEAESALDAGGEVARMLQECGDGNDGRKGEDSSVSGESTASHKGHRARHSHGRACYMCGVRYQPADIVGPISAIGAGPGEVVASFTNDDPSAESPTADPGQRRRRRAKLEPGQETHHGGDRSAWGSASAKREESTGAALVVPFRNTVPNFGYMLTQRMVLETLRHLDSRGQSLDSFAAPVVTAFRRAKEQAHMGGPASATGPSEYHSLADTLELNRKWSVCRLCYEVHNAQAHLHSLSQRVAKLLHLPAQCTKEPARSSGRGGRSDKDEAGAAGASGSSTGTPSHPGPAPGADSIFSLTEIGRGPRVGVTAAPTDSNGTCLAAADIPPNARQYRIILLINELQDVVSDIPESMRCGSRLDFDNQAKSHERTLARDGCGSDGRAPERGGGSEGGYTSGALAELRYCMPGAGGEVHRVAVPLERRDGLRDDICPVRQVRLHYLFATADGLRNFFINESVVLELHCPSPVSGPTSAANRSFRMEGQSKIYFTPFLSFLSNHNSCQKVDLSLRMETRGLGAITVNASMVVIADDVEQASLVPSMPVRQYRGQSDRARPVDAEEDEERQAAQRELFWLPEGHFDLLLLPTNVMAAVAGRQAALTDAVGTRAQRQRQQALIRREHGLLHAAAPAPPSARVGSSGTHDASETAWATALVAAATTGLVGAGSTSATIAGNRAARQTWLEWDEVMHATSAAVSGPVAGTASQCSRMCWHVCRDELRLAAITALEVGARGSRRHARGRLEHLRGKSSGISLTELDANFLNCCITSGQQGTNACIAGGGQRKKKMVPDGDDEGSSSDDDAGHQSPPKQEEQTRCDNLIETDIDEYDALLSFMGAWVQAETTVSESSNERAKRKQMGNVVREGPISTFRMTERFHQGSGTPPCSFVAPVEGSPTFCRAFLHALRSEYEALSSAHGNGSYGRAHRLELLARLRRGASSTGLRTPPFSSWWDWIADAIQECAVDVHSLQGGLPVDDQAKSVAGHDETDATSVVTWLGWGDLVACTRLYAQRQRCRHVTHQAELNKHEEDDANEGESNEGDDVAAALHLNLNQQLFAGATRIAALRKLKSANATGKRVSLLERKRRSTVHHLNKQAANARNEAAAAEEEGDAQPEMPPLGRFLPPWAYLLPMSVERRWARLDALRAIFCNLCATRASRGDEECPNSRNTAGTTLLHGTTTVPSTTHKGTGSTSCTAVGTGHHSLQDGKVDTAELRALLEQFVKEATAASEDGGLGRLQRLIANHCLAYAPFQQLFAQYDSSGHGSIHWGEWFALGTAALNQADLEDTMTRGECDRASHTSTTSTTTSRATNRDTLVFAADGACVACENIATRRDVQGFSENVDSDLSEQRWLQLQSAQKREAELLGSEATMPVTTRGVLAATRMLQRKHEAARTARKGRGGGCDDDASSMPILCTTLPNYNPLPEVIPSPETSAGGYDELGSLRAPERLEDSPPPTRTGDTDLRMTTTAATAGHTRRTKKQATTTTRGVAHGKPRKVLAPLSRSSHATDSDNLFCSYQGAVKRKEGGQRGRKATGAKATTAARKRRSKKQPPETAHDLYRMAEQEVAELEAQLSRHTLPGRPAPSPALGVRGGGSRRERPPAADEETLLRRAEIEIERVEQQLAW